MKLKMAAPAAHEGLVPLGWGKKRKEKSLLAFYILLFAFCFLRFAFWVTSSGA
jgi:hypothetical protein